MTIKSDAISLAQTFDSSAPLRRTLKRDLNNQFPEGLDYQNATLSPTDEVQTITPGDRTGGTFQLHFTLFGGETFQTTSLAFNAAASTVQTAVDVAAASVAGYTAGDIAVTGGAFGDSGSDTIFTFSGASVLGKNHPIIEVANTFFSGGTVGPVPSETTAGVPGRFWFAALRAMGVITSGTDPAFQAAPAGQYTVAKKGDLENYPAEETIRALLTEADAREGQDWSTEILTLIGWPLTTTN